MDQSGGEQVGATKRAGNDGKNVELHELQNEHNREVVQHNENETQSNEKH